MPGWVIRDSSVGQNKNGKKGVVVGVTWKGG